MCRPGTNGCAATRGARARWAVESASCGRALLRDVSAGAGQQAAGQSRRSECGQGDLGRRGAGASVQADGAGGVTRRLGAAEVIVLVATRFSGARCALGMGVA